MKIDFRGNDLIVFLNQQYIKEVDFLNKSVLENYFKDLFMKFNEFYDIEISGSYDITVYKDNFYGVILCLSKDDLDYFDYYDSNVDMSIVISKCKSFLYKLIGNVDDNILNKCDIYLFDGDVYLCPKKIDYINMGILVENCDIIYGNDTLKVINNGWLLKN